MPTSGFSFTLLLIVYLKVFIITCLWQCYDLFPFMLHSTNACDTVKCRQYYGKRSALCLWIHTKAKEGKQSSCSLLYSHILKALNLEPFELFTVNDSLVNLKSELLRTCVAPQKLPDLSVVSGASWSGNQYINNHISKYMIIYYWLV